MNESEVILHRNPDEDRSAKARHCDTDKHWTVESYDAVTTKAMRAAGAAEQPSAHSGRLFTVDARQLIQFIAAENGLTVEFRQRKRQTLTPEKAEARRLRMAALNAAQRVKT